MEEIINKQIEGWALEKTFYQIGLCMLAIVLIVSFMTKHFKSISEAMPSIRKALSYVQKKWFSEAMFKKDLLDRFDRLEQQLLGIKNEVQYNGGTRKLTDAVKGLEEGQRIITAKLEHSIARRDITDLCSERMLFRTNEKGACTFINDAFLKQFGYTESDVLAFAFENLVHEDDKNDMDNKWTKSINNKTRFSDEQKIRDCTGAYHKCAVKAYPIISGEELKEFAGTIDFINE